MSSKGIIASTGRVLGQVSGYFLLLLILLVTADVCGRYFFSSPIPGALEVAVVILGVAILLSLFYTTTAKGHITIDLLVNRFSPRGQGIINTFSSLLVIAIWGLIVWQGAVQGIASWQMSETVMPFGYPRVLLFPFKFLLPVVAFLICLELIIELREWFYQAIGKKRL